MLEFYNKWINQENAIMELRDYISETLVQISEGISDAMHKLEGKGVIVNPNSTFHSDGQFWIGKHQEHACVSRRVQEIEMNITTIVMESTEGQGGAKLNVGVLNVGGGVKDIGSEQKSNTIKFSIPVCLPCTNIIGS